MTAVDIDADPATPDDGHRPGSHRVMLALVVLGVLVAMSTFAGSDGGGVVVLEVPGGRQALASVLDDGTPVWVATGRDGQVRVFEAFTPTDGPIGGLVGWCARGNRYVDPVLGLSFSPGGDRYNGFVPARLDRIDDRREGLIPREFEVGGEGGEGDPIRVTEPLEASSGLRSPPLGGEQGHGPPLGCRLGDDAEVDADRSGAVADADADSEGPSSSQPPVADPLDGLVDHSFLVTPLDAGTDGWQLADGHLMVRPDGTAAWCNRVTSVSETPPDPTQCDVEGDVRVDLPIEPDAAGTVTTIIGDPLAVQLHDGVLVRAAVLPHSTWIGSSLGRTLTLEVGVYGLDPTSSRLAVSVQRSLANTSCLSVAPSDIQAIGGNRVFYLDTRTVIDLEGLTDLAELSTLNALTDPVRATVTMDRVICRALAIRNPA